MRALEALATAYVNQSEDVLRNIHFGLIIVGALAAGILNKDRSELQRAPYLVFSSLILLSTVVVGSIWTLSFQAMAGGYLSLLMGIYLAWFLLTGFLLGRIAMARSRDAYGHGLYAALAFVPIANLWLLLKQSKNAVSPNRSPVMAALQGVSGAVVGLVVVTLAVVLNGMLIDRLNTIAEEASSKPASVRGLIEDMIRSQGLAETLRVMAAEASIPHKVDSVTTLDRITATGLLIIWSLEQGISWLIRRIATKHQ